MKYQAVIFDLFGTLVDNFSRTEHKSILSDMALVLGTPVESFMDVWFDTFTMRCVGDIKTTTENITYICNRLNIFPNSRQLEAAATIRFNYTQKSLVPKNSVIDTLVSIKKQGHKLGLISDCSSEVPLIWKETLFSTLFDTTIFSCEAGIKKPDVGIYRLACEKLAVSPSQCLYVGDGGSNELSGAQSAGMVPLLICDPNEFDAHRIDAHSWSGNIIERMAEVLDSL